VAASPFQGGQGDVVRQFVDAAHEGNVRVALALSPLDRHEPTYGTPAYQAVFECQLRELLTMTEPTYDQAATREFVHRIQPQTLVEFANANPIRASEVRSIAQASPSTPPPPSDQSNVLSPGGAAGPALYIPAESVYGIRPGWFWHPSEDAQVKTLDELLDMYFDSVGRNSLLRLNVPPDTRGLLPDPDVDVLNQFGQAITALYRTNVAAGQAATADSIFQDLPVYAATSAVDGKANTFWAAAAGKTTARLEVDLAGRRTFDLISVQEPIALGERTTQHRIEAGTNGAWTTVATGTVIGQRKLHRINPVTADSVALVITGARGAPAVTEFGVYDTTRAR
jgi:alpha-L-fucosidase